MNTPSGYDHGVVFSKTLGDRLSACRAPIHPVGLGMKPSHNRYAPAGGELMLVHRCEACGAVSLNRIAADDDPAALRRLAGFRPVSLPGIRLLAAAELASHAPYLFRQEEVNNVYS